MKDQSRRRASCWTPLGRWQVQQEERRISRTRRRNTALRGKHSLVFALVMRAWGRKLRMKRIQNHHSLHHATVLVIENMAVQHELARKIEKAGANPHAPWSCYSAVHSRGRSRRCIAPVRQRIECRKRRVGGEP